VNDQVGSGRPLLVSGSDSATTIAGSVASVVIGNSNTTTSNTSQLSFAALTGVNSTYFTSAAINCVFGARTNGQYPTGQLVFSTSTSLNTAPTEKMRLDNSGNLLVGTTSNNGTVTSFNSSNIGRAGFFMINAASSLAADALGVSKFDNNTTTSQVFVKFFINNNAAASGLITANGANQAAFTSSSDARLKENITPLDPQLEKICSLKPCEFDYKDGTGRQTGFIAQEVMEIYPDLVGESADGMLTLSDMSKNDARLIKAIQELKAQNDELKARVAALENAK
jgi:hypothetical protein